MKKYLKLMRVHHYIKNILIFFPLIFSGQLFNGSLLIKTLLGFLAFSMASSSIYIFNDINDAENDKNHPTKCKRPIASGEVSLKNAWIFVAILFISALIINYFSFGLNISAWIMILTYIFLNLGYSLGLKNVPIIDIAILVSGFLLRVIYGSVITDIEISKWLYLTVISMSFYLGLGKRRNEILKQDNETRKVLKYYNYNFLDKNMYMCLALTITFYSLWTVDPSTINRISNTYLIWTVPLIILICMKYSLNVEGDSDGDPVEVVLKDKVLLLLIILFTIISLCIIYI